MQSVDEALAQASQWLLNADALVVGSGAGMGADSGLATFRGSGQSGAWGGLEALGLAYEDICQPRWFKEDPRLAWAFWDFCREAYRKARPHQGYSLLQSWAETVPRGAFSVTSNIDGHWEAAGWSPERLFEVHGAVRWLQCSAPCAAVAQAAQWKVPGGKLGLSEDATTHRVQGTLPTCSSCGAMARPAVQMFGGDVAFSQQRRLVQGARYNKWLRELAERPEFVSLRVVCLEVGCGLAVPTIRKELETVLERFPSARLVRVNPEHCELGADLNGRAVGVPLPASQALRRLQELREGCRTKPALDLSGYTLEDALRIERAQPERFQNLSLNAKWVEMYKAACSEKAAAVPEGQLHAAKQAESGTSHHSAGPATNGGRGGDGGGGGRHAQPTTGHHEAQSVAAHQQRHQPATEKRFWKIVGGEETGGVMVREGRELSSPKVEGRISHGALVRQLELEDGRLHFAKVQGRGPAGGWISIALQQRDSNSGQIRHKVLAEPA